MALLATSLPDGIMVKTFEDRMASSLEWARCRRVRAAGAGAWCRGGGRLWAPGAPGLRSPRGRPHPFLTGLGARLSWGEGRGQDSPARV